MINRKSLTGISTPPPPSSKWTDLIQKAGLEKGFLKLKEMAENNHVVLVDSDDDAGHPGFKDTVLGNLILERDVDWFRATVFESSTAGGRTIQVTIPVPRDDLNGCASGYVQGLDSTGNIVTLHASAILRMEEPGEGSARGLSTYWAIGKSTMEAFFAYLETLEFAPPQPIPSTMMDWLAKDYDGDSITYHDLPEETIAALAQLEKMRFNTDLPVHSLDLIPLYQPGLTRKVTDTARKVFTSEVDDEELKKFLDKYILKILIEKCRELSREDQLAIIEALKGPPVDTGRFKIGQKMLVMCFYHEGEPYPPLSWYTLGFVVGQPDYDWKVRIIELEVTGHRKVRNSTDDSSNPLKPHDGYFLRDSEGVEFSNQWPIAVPNQHHHFEMVVPSLLQLRTLLATYKGKSYLAVEDVYHVLSSKHTRHFENAEHVPNLRALIEKELSEKFQSELFVSHVEIPGDGKSPPEPGFEIRKITQ